MTKINSCLPYTCGSEEPHRLRNRNRTGARDEAKNQTSITEVRVDVMRTPWRDFLCVNRSVHSCTGAMLPGCCCSAWNANCITSFICKHGVLISLDHSVMCSMHDLCVQIYQKPDLFILSISNELDTPDGMFHVTIGYISRVHL